MIKFLEHQIKAISQLKTGSILWGRTGSGKSLTSLGYYYSKECGGDIDPEKFSPLKNPKDLYIITVPKKRDSLEWERECAKLMLSRDRSISISGVSVKIDSWNNIAKYTQVKDCFFIFDEQRVIGSGSWVKSFLKIVKNNNWILLSATPGDTWMDYIPAFVANGFYKNRTEFLREHVVYNNFTKYPKIDKYINIYKLHQLKDSITVRMLYARPTNIISNEREVRFDQNIVDIITKKRWNPFTNRPIKDISEYGRVLRTSINSDPSRLQAIRNILKKHDKIIVFYNFNYELDILRKLSQEIEVAEYNGKKHEPIPEKEKWVYLVQYSAGSEAWNCTQTNVVVFYSLNYSYRIMKQSEGRVDRLDTPFKNLYYYRLISKSFIDLAIKETLNQKKDFNEKKFLLSHQKHGL